MLRGRPGRSSRQTNLDCDEPPLLASTLMRRCPRSSPAPEHRHLSPNSAKTDGRGPRHQTFRYQIHFVQIRALVSSCPALANEKSLAIANPRGGGILRGKADLYSSHIVSL